MMNEEIRLIELPLDGSVTILSHPNQSSIYSDRLDEAFVESVRIHDLKERPVVCKATDIKEGLNEDFDENTIVIVSGHRRIKAKKKLKQPSVICELRPYDNYFDSEVDHIIFNKQRNKNDEEIAKEINAYKQKLDQFRKALKNDGDKALETFKSFNVVQYVQRDEKGNLTLPTKEEIIEKELNQKRRKIDNAHILYSEGDDSWLQDKWTKIDTSNLSPKKKKIAREGLEKAQNEILKLIRDNKISENKGREMLLSEWKTIESAINPEKAKPKSKKKKKNNTKKWLKPKDFTLSKVDISSPEGKARVGTKSDGRKYLAEQEGEFVHLYSKKHKEVFTVDTSRLYEYLREQRL